MRRSASEVIRELEMRIARLERQSSPRDRILERARESRVERDRAHAVYGEMVDFGLKTRGMPISDCVESFVARFKNTDERHLKTIAFTFFYRNEPKGRLVQKTNGSLPAIAKAICEDPEKANSRRLV